MLLVTIRGGHRNTYSVVAAIIYGMTFQSSLGIVGSHRVRILYQCLQYSNIGSQSATKATPDRRV